MLNHIQNATFPHLKPAKQHSPYCECTLNNDDKPTDTNNPSSSPVRLGQRRWLSLFPFYVRVAYQMVLCHVHRVLNKQMHIRVATTCLDAQSVKCRDQRATLAVGGC